MNLRNRPYLVVEMARNGKVGHRENVDKIRFPSYCYYSKDGKHKRLGVINQNDGIYYLIDMAIQKKRREDVDGDENLNDLLARNHIQIVKVKTIIFE